MISLPAFDPFGSWTAFRRAWRGDWLRPNMDLITSLVQQGKTEVPESARLEQDHTTLVTRTNDRRTSGTSSGLSSARAGGDTPELVTSRLDPTLIPVLVCEMSVAQLLFGSDKQLDLFIFFHQTCYLLTQERGTQL